MGYHDLVLDRHVFVWVFIPLTCAVVLKMLLRQYVSKLMSVGGGGRKEELREIREAQALLKSQKLREQGGWITHVAFLRRRAHLASKDSGVLCQKVESKSLQETVATDPSMMVNMLKSQLTGLIAWPSSTMALWSTLMLQIGCSLCKCAMALSRFAALRVSHAVLRPPCFLKRSQLPSPFLTPHSQRSQSSRVIRENPAFVVPLEQYDTPSDNSQEDTSPTTDAPPQRLTLADIPPQMRHLLMYKAKKKRTYVMIGKKGVDTGVLNSLMLHFRRHEVVKVTVSKQWSENVADIATELERRSGGIILHSAGRKMTIYRGFSNEDTPEKTPPEQKGWWEEFAKERSASQ